ncbi:hypothetical protein JW905_14245, partial [bacterium]|nr:hypothetical protein [candidate division CSSED10-310 bacterium]
MKKTREGTVGDAGLSRFPAFCPLLAIQRVTEGPPSEFVQPRLPSLLGLAGDRRFFVYATRKPPENGVADHRRFLS